MGYTHYYTGKKKFSDSEWQTIQTDVLAILKAAKTAGVVLGDGMGEIMIEPEFAIEPTAIRFNGLNDDAHETFYVDQGNDEWSFCKTARKPYDVAVTAILAYLEGAHPDKFSVGSDGDSDDWQAGIKLLKTALGTRAAFAQVPAEILADAA